MFAQQQGDHDDGHECHLDRVEDMNLPAGSVLVGPRHEHTLLASMFAVNGFRAWQSRRMRAVVRPARLWQAGIQVAGSRHHAAGMRGIMVSDEMAVSAALDAAEAALACGEMPIGAAVFLGDEKIATAWTQEKRLRRRIVHADLLAMQAADEKLGFSRKTEALTLAVNLEPCLMCLGAAITLGVDTVVFALESPNDGGVEALSHWNPEVELPYFRKPSRIVGGVQRERARSQFATYANGSGPTSMRAWARDLAGLPANL